MPSARDTSPRAIPAQPETTIHMYPEIKLDELPDILCGPILRKVTKDSVSVFLVTKNPCAVKLEVKGLVPAETLVTPSWPEHDLLQIGQNLYAGVITARELLLHSNSVYGYDLTLKFKNGTSKSLADLGLLDGALNYKAKSLILPSFVLPQAGSSLRICHGSCRKIHAPGKDALAFLDDLIESDARTVGRPQQLLLTGDQIYADDVAPAVLRVVSDLATLLVSGKDVPENVVDFVDAGLPKPRDGLLDHVGKRPNRDGGALTSTMGLFHLARLGEFYAMYLLAWNDKVWPIKVDRNVDAAKSLDATYPGLSEFSLSNSPNDVKAAAEFLLGKTKDRIRDFLDTLGKVRRLLANIPTYMMFDDHEITDDWFMDETWRANALGKPAATQVIRNGLLAYCVFQKWGNSPEDLDLGKTEWPFLPLSFANKLGEAVSFQNSAVLDSLGLSATSTAAGPNFSFKLEFDTHRLIFVDTRTRRAGNTDWDDDGAWELKLFRSFDDVFLHPAPVQGIPSIVIFPPPLLGLPVVESMQLHAVEKARALSRAADAEFAGGNAVFFHEILQKLAAFGRVVIVSGDVHYGFTRLLHYFSRTGTSWDLSATAATIVQVCSSALKNSPLPAEAGNYEPLSSFITQVLVKSTPVAFAVKALDRSMFGSSAFFGIKPASPAQRNLSPKRELHSEEDLADLLGFVDPTSAPANWRKRIGVPRHWLVDEHLTPPVGGVQAWDDVVDWCFKMEHVQGGSLSGIAPLTVHNNLGELKFTVKFTTNSPDDALVNILYYDKGSSQTVTQTIQLGPPTLDRRPSLALKP